MFPYLPMTDENRRYMLEMVGASSLEELLADIPATVRCLDPLNVPGPLAEMELARHIKALAGQNKHLEDYACFLGAGVYDHYVPSVITHILTRQEFYTAYTPYQPEISQGTLQAIFEYQTMICAITGMEVSNASVYDGATALAEAITMSTQANNRREILICRSVHPEARAVAATYARFGGVEIKEVGCVEGLADIHALAGQISDKTSAVVVQNPNFFGLLENLEQLSQLAHRHKALLIVSADPIALGLLKSPGSCGADIVVGEGQSLGNPLSFGGPYFGFMSTTEKLMRRLPGRIVGQTTDSAGNRGFILTLQAREQHIRRGKASSNICSNQALCALAATIYLTLLGKEGLRQVAEQCLQKAHYTRNRLLATGKYTATFHGPFFKEFVVSAQEDPEGINKRLLEHRIVGGYCLAKDYPELARGVLIAVTENRTREEIDRLIINSASE